MNQSSGKRCDGRFFLRALTSLLLALSLVGLAGCAGSAQGHPHSSADSYSAEAPDAAQAGAGASHDASEEPTPDAAGILDVSQVPAYAGVPSIAVNGDVPAFSDEEKALGYGHESYASLDALGRCGMALAVVGDETMPTEERGDIGAVKPSGWHTVRYDDLVDGRYLYNRCHLIGFQLSGENANARNLVTGTRYMNTEGMLPYEDEVADYVDETGNHVLYRSTPVFVGDELVARGVHLEALSLEDGGAGVAFNVYCYNVQPGVEIDYATGESWRAEAAGSLASGATANGQGEAQALSASSEAAEASYILNTNSKKFHRLGCSAVGQMKESNKQEYSGTRDELVARGYAPCKRCNP